MVVVVVGLAAAAAEVDAEAAPIGVRTCDFALPTCTSPSHSAQNDALSSLQKTVDGFSSQLLHFGAAAEGAGVGAADGAGAGVGCVGAGCDEEPPAVGRFGMLRCSSIGTRLCAFALPVWIWSSQLSFIQYDN